VTDDWERALNDDVPRLAALIQELGVEEIEVSEGDRTIRLRRSTRAVAPAAAEDAALAPETVEPEDESGVVTVRAEYVGVFRRTDDEAADLPVDEGAAVEEGQSIGLVDVLGVLHEVPAPGTGVVERFLVVDGHPVEFGQPLARLVPDSADQA
jgi:acetyl-CoA carboxylase biotin carboxyl carrier protein